MSAPRPCRERGLGLLEVLVALVVVSFGVLGMAGLQLTGMKHSSGGFNRTRALLLAENMATRLRINTPDEALAEVHAVYDGFDSGEDAGAFCAVPPRPYCQASAAGPASRCAPAELAAFDLWSVACGDRGDDAAGSRIDEALPSGRLAVSCDTSPCRVDSTWTIAVEWREGSGVSADPDDVETRSVRMRLRP